jgi:ADP-heptose:LPS heptosyltransferase
VAAPSALPRLPERILVIMLRRIGDVVLTTPAARALRKLFPLARLDFLTEPPCDQVLAACPEASRVLVYERGVGRAAWPWRLNRARYDLVVDYMGTPRSAILAFATRAPVRAGPAHVSHRWAYTHRLVESPKACYSALEKIRVLRGLGLAPDESDFLPAWRTEPAAERWAAGALAGLGEVGKDVGALVGLVPASRRPTRRWPAASYAALGRRLRQELGARVLIFWGPGERALAREIELAIGDGAAVAPPTKDLFELGALLGRCRLVVTNCNGPRHIAVARGVPTLAIHGSSDPASWNPPDDPRFPYIRLESLHCIGCRKNVCPYHLECMRDLSADAVFERARALMEATKAWT